MQSGLGSESDLCLQGGATQQEMAEDVDSVLQDLGLMLDFDAVRRRGKDAEEVVKLLGNFLPALSGVALWRCGEGA